ncbi:MFS transporter [Salinactinospora qingdaonensis]|uniref:MFS transporter n=1 Tax=Salinactinospora qingdaonensis TaxID=702744 RepID=A0ABP7EZH3_9ACTN
MLFGNNGFTYANVVPWLPTIKNELELSNTALGAAVAAMPLGALVLGMLAGPLINRFGSGRTAVGAGLIIAWVLPVVALAPNWPVLAAALFTIGYLDAWTDSAMNAHGLRVQRRYRRTIINTFHAVWSISGVAGGLVGATMAGLGVPMFAHMLAAAVLLTALALIAVRLLLPGDEHSERSAPTISAGPAQPSVRLSWRTTGALVALGTLLMLAAAMEDAAASWGAVYMREELAATAFLAGLPFVAASAMMTLGRLTGDRLTDRFGAVNVTRTGSLLAALGLGMALALPTPATTIIGFGLVGFGIATLFPLALAAAGELPGISSGNGVTIVGWLARAGFLCVPPLIGFISDSSSLRVGLLLIPLAGLVAALLSSSLRPRSAAPSPASPQQPGG